MNIYKFKTGSGKIIELANQFNKTDFGRIVCGFSVVPMFIGIAMILMYVALDIIALEVNVWIYFVIGMMSFLFWIITELIYFYFLKDYVGSLKDEK